MAAIILGAAMQHNASAVANFPQPTDAASARLARVLLQHHPEAFDNPADAFARRMEQPVPIPRVDESLELELAARARLTRSSPTTKTTAFAQGEGALAKISAVGCPEELQELYTEELVDLRVGLVAQYGSDADTLMLVDTAVVGFFEARHYALLARTVLRNGPSGTNVRTAERLDAMADRAHRRALGALELLRRPQGAAISVTFEAATKGPRPTPPARRKRGRT